MKRLTVVQILPALNSGGVERGTLEVARALVAAGHRSIVVSAGGRMVAQLEKEGTEHITMPVHRKAISSLYQIRPFRRLLTELKPDILHARSRIPGWISWLAWRKLPANDRPHFLTTVHGLYSVSFYSAIMTKGERVIAVSETVREYILKNYPQCEPAKIELIYRGIDPAEFPYDHKPTAEWLAKWRADYPQLEGKTVLTLPGRITRLKGHEDFIELIAALRAQQFPVHGVIAGGPEANKAAYFEEIKLRAAQAGLGSDITFTGHRSDLREVLAVSDIAYSLTTKPETFGRTTLEALNLGTPVLGWNKGGIAEILKARFPQGAVTPGDKDMLLAATIALLKNPVRPAPAADFQLSTMLSQELALYQSVVEGV